MDKNKLLITRNTSPEEISEYIKVLRERKGSEKETLKMIDEVLVFGHDFVVNLFFEEALTYQHLVMNDESDNDSLINMQKSILKAGFYIKKYRLVKWLSRYYRFLGRIEDYKKNYKKAILYYKKAIYYVKFDPEPYRFLELEGFLSSSIILGGQPQKGYKLTKSVLMKFEDSEEGKNLKKNDYKTWAIWKSGVVIRVLNNLIEKNVTFDTNEAKRMIVDIEKNLTPRDNFSYRIEELDKIKARLM